MNYTVTVELPDGLEDLTWSQQRGETTSLGVEVLLTNDMEERLDERLKAQVTKILLGLFAQGLVSKSLLPLATHLETEHMPHLSATRYVQFVDAVFHPFLLLKVEEIQGKMELLQARLSGSRLRLAWRALRGRL